MVKRAFDDVTGAGTQVAEYRITPDADSNHGARMSAQTTLRAAIEKWVLNETGVKPSVTLLSSANPQTNEGLLYITCSAAFMRKLETQFAGEIAKVDLIKPVDTQRPQTPGQAAVQQSLNLRG
jgi:hypothetical protein